MYGFLVTLKGNLKHFNCINSTGIKMAYNVYIEINALQTVCTYISLPVVRTMYYLMPYSYKHLKDIIFAVFTDTYLVIYKFSKLYIRMKHS